MPVNIERYILRAGKISTIAHVNNFIIYFPTLRQVEDLIRLDLGSIARLLSPPLGGSGLHHATNDSTIVEEAFYVYQALLCTRKFNGYSLDNNTPALQQVRLLIGIYLLITTLRMLS